jgi:RNA polymerase sigma-70 factor (family 1)
MNQNGSFGNTVRKKVPSRHLLSNPTFEESIHSFDLNNREDFTTIYNKLYPYAFFFAKKIVGTEDAADIVSSVFCKLWSHKNTFENLPHVKAYLRISIRNACISYLRKQESRFRREETGFKEIYNDETVNGYLKEEIGAEKLLRIYAEIERLPHRSKEIFKMAYLHNLKNPEIARRLGITARTVQNQKSSALKILRMTLLTILCLLLYKGNPLVRIGTNTCVVRQITSGL